MSALRFHWRLPQGGERTGASRSLQASLSETGLPDLDQQASFCRAAEDAGIEGLLTDFGWSKPDSILLSLALGERTRTIKFIIAYRSGLICPVSFVQQLNTLSTLIGGRFSINVVAGHSPEEQKSYGDLLPHDERYARTEEFLAVCNALWMWSRPVDYHGTYYRVEAAKLNTPFVSCDGEPRPELYIAGNSEPARQLAIAQGSCWMMMADAPSRIAGKVGPVLAAGRTIGLRMSVITRETRGEAIEAARAIACPPGFDSATAENRFVSRSDATGMRATFELSADEWLTPWLWTGLVRTHGAPALAMVGSYDEVAGGLLEYKAAGVTQFILSSWPKLEEMVRFGEEVIPRVRAREEVSDVAHHHELRAV
jgi:alkanesulfonate monooxygenase